MFRCHFCSGFAFDSITFYSLLAIFNDSSETIRTKGESRTSFVLFSWRAWLHSWLPGEVSPSQEENEAEVFILLWKFQGSLLPIITPTNYSSQISMENTDVELFHVCRYISRRLRK